MLSARSPCSWYFNPPTPCGVGPRTSVPLSAVYRFQSTHPVRGGTIQSSICFRRSLFQSTHPVRGGTRRCGLPVWPGSYFNPPTPCGVGRSFPVCGEHASDISIHPPRAGWDGGLVNDDGVVRISIHPPRAGWDNGHALLLALRYISIHPPRAGWDSWRSPPRN